MMAALEKKNTWASNQTKFQRLNHFKRAFMQLVIHKHIILPKFQLIQPKL